MNHAAETLLHEAGLLTASSPFYRGRPILITENDYIHKLFNGDTGIILPDPATGNRRAFFANPDGTTRAIPPEFLPAHVTAFAMTVHKSQGSEFDRVLIVLPPDDTLLLTMELDLYRNYKSTAGCNSMERRSCFQLCGEAPDGAEKRVEGESDFIGYTNSFSQPFSCRALSVIVYFLFAKAVIPSQPRQNAVACSWIKKLSPSGTYARNS